MFLKANQLLEPNSKLALIVAVSDNGIIGRENTLPWRISADLQRFKKLTMGHAIIMGRKTFDSIGRLLPGRKTIILTRDQEFALPGATLAYDWSDVWTNCAADAQPFVVGGATIYEQSIAWCQTLYLTRVHTEIAGDASFRWDENQWILAESATHQRDARNEFDYTFETYDRIQKNQ